MDDSDEVRAQRSCVHVRGLCVCVADVRALALAAA